MALDHYVSQVHLRNFTSPALGGKQMNGIRKADLAEFPCSPKDVCRRKDGSTNPFLQEPRIIEEFLKEIEPRYNAAIAKFHSGNIDAEAVFVVAGFLAYIASCSPAGMRLGIGPLAGVLRAEAYCVSKSKELPTPPASLGISSLADGLDRGVIGFDIDPKYPQALGIRQILQRTSVWGNSDWDILVNEDHLSPFFTSDFPVAIEETRDPFVLNRIAPLSPSLAVRIRPRPSERGILNLAFPSFRFRRQRPSHAEVRVINEAIVKCAEELVFFRDNLPWVHKFVAKHASYRIESESELSRVSDGTIVRSAMRIRPTTWVPA